MATGSGRSMPDANAFTANVAARSARPRSGQPRRRKDAVVHTRTVESGGLGVSFDLQTAIIDNVKDDGHGHALGAKPGWRITEIDGNPYTYPTFEFC